MKKTLHLEELPYSLDSCELFERLRDMPGAALLDSSYPHAHSGRFDILTANPVAAGPSPLLEQASEAQLLSYYDSLKAFHRDRYQQIRGAAQELPFCGGLLGYAGYDSGKALNRVANRRNDSAGVPAINIQAYDWCVIQDHLLKRAVLVAQPHVSATERRDIAKRLSRPHVIPATTFKLELPFTSNMSQNAYQSAFEQIQKYIHAGDCYQVNLAQRFSAPYSGDPWSVYRQLRAIAAAPYSAFLSLDDDSAILSLSPERFLSLHGHHVTTAPIKGTRPRFSDPQADELAASELLHSQKDRAENLMIVDLLRNDLGRSCVPGSIHVERLFELQSFPTVHHLVSTISGELREELHAVDLLLNSFPGGSITGAPKRRSMEIIEELEPHARQAYCGSVLYISADGRMDSNIAIRTLICREQEIHCWGGGGIVADSQWQQEYQETYDKVGKFLGHLEATIQT
ncbi:MAG: aminodeoxychorismate synthase component I [Halioglobus sp.]